MPTAFASWRIVFVTAGGVIIERPVSEGCGRSVTDGTVGIDCPVEESVMEGVLGFRGVAGRECAVYQSRTGGIVMDFVSFGIFEERIVAVSR